MLAVRFDIVIPSVGCPNNNPTNQVDDDQQKIPEKIISLVFSVTCNIFFVTQKKRRNPSSERKSQTISQPDFFGDNIKKNDNDFGDDEVQCLVQYIIQPYFIITNLPKKEKFGNFRLSEKSQNPEISGYPEVPIYDKPVSFLVQVANTEGVSVLPTKPIFLPFLGQLSNLLHPLLTPKPAPSELLLPAPKLSIQAGPLSHPSVLIHVESPPQETEKPLSYIPEPPPTPSEPEFVLNVRKILSEDSPNHVELCEDGVGGTYFIRDHRTPLAVFKPSDEEPGASLNPKKKLDKPLLPPGGGARREYAAYVLDDSHAGVPETYLVEKISHRKMSNGGNHPIPKSGSLQRFVSNKGDSSSMSPSRFSVEDVHAVAVLDLRILNLDRNGENLLVCTSDDPNDDKGVRLVPIDHTYVLPPSLDYDPYFEWHYWRQTKEPLSPATLSYIASLDPERDAQLLRTAGIDEGSIRTMKIATLLLQKGTSLGLTLFDIANMVCRGRKQKSELSEIVTCAENSQTEFWSELTFLIEQAVRSKKDLK